MGEVLSWAIFMALIWGGCRVTKPLRYQWLIGLGLIVFFFKFAIPWVVAAEETRDDHYLDHELLLSAILYLGVTMLTDNWWRSDDPK